MYDIPVYTLGRSVFAINLIMGLFCVFDYLDTCVSSSSSSSIHFARAMYHAHTHTNTYIHISGISGLARNGTSVEECILYSIIFDRNIYFHLAFAVRAQTNGEWRFSRRNINTELYSPHEMHSLFVSPIFYHFICSAYLKMCASVSMCVCAFVLAEWRKQNKRATVINVCDAAVQFSSISKREQITRDMTHQSMLHHSSERCDASQIVSCLTMTFGKFRGGPSVQHSANDFYFLFLFFFLSDRKISRRNPGTVNWMDTNEFSVHLMGFTQKQRKSQNEFYAERFAAIKLTPECRMPHFCAIPFTVLPVEGNGEWRIHCWMERME